jgi:AraC family ethanolamine operon transcriptional activator
MDYIASYADVPPTIQDLCRAAEVSERTLHYAFLEEYGTTPKAYTKSYRLNAARKVLRGADPSFGKIADIAGYWGFWHMGQFAADYRKMFGELPSQTLQMRGANTVKSTLADLGPIDRVG